MPLEKAGNACYNSTVVYWVRRFCYAHFQGIVPGSGLEMCISLQKHPIQQKFPIGVSLGRLKKGRTCT